MVLAVSEVIEWIINVAAAISAVVAIALFVLSIRWISNRERRAAGIALLVVGVLGVPIGFFYGEWIQMIADHPVLSGIAGIACGFAWPGAIVAGLATIGQRGERSLAKSSASGVLRAFAILFFIAATPGAFGFAALSWFLVRDREFSHLSMLAPFLLLFGVPAFIGWALWRVASRRSSPAAG